VAHDGPAASEALRHVDAECTVGVDAARVHVRFGAPQRVLSWAPYRGGYCEAQSVAIWQVTNAQLPLHVDPLALVRTYMQQLDANGVGLLTSRSIDKVEVACAELAGISARAVVTAGLSNALCIGDTPGPLRQLGTINSIVQTSVPLSLEAALECSSLVAEARTVAVLEAAEPSRRSLQPATGTGTDCIVVCSPLGSTAESYAGKHTAVGHLVGTVALSALRAAVQRWSAEHGRPSRS
jgi:adenosylcobinamide amidohydrolase